MNNIVFDYSIDLSNIINHTIHIDSKTNYRDKAYEIQKQIDNYRIDYVPKDYGNILFLSKIEQLYPQLETFNYLASLQLFYSNNYHYFPTLQIVDMHGLYSQEMLDIFDILYHIWYNNNLLTNIHIITGCGNHILHNKLKKYLKLWDIKFTIRNNYTIVILHL